MRDLKKPGGRERHTVMLDVEETLDNYCRACIFSGSSTVQEACKQCPISFQLRDYGEELGWVDSPKKSAKPVRWTVEEDDYLIAALGKVPVQKIADKLGRHAPVVHKRIKRLRNDGLLK